MAEVAGDLGIPHKTLEFWRGKYRGAAGYAGGETMLRVDRRTKGGRWVRLGDFEMKAGNGLVSLSAGIAEKTQSLAADAVKVTNWPAGTGKVSVADDAVTSAGVIAAD